MLGIVTAMRSRAVTPDWDYHVWLLERTLNSILAQPTSSYFVNVVSHERPNLKLVHPEKVNLLQVDFAAPSANNDEMCADKVFKLSIGIQAAINAGATHVMFTDADDLINRNTSTFVQYNELSVGWFSAHQLCYVYGGYWLRNYKLPEASSGPCAIVRADLLDFDDVTDGRDWTNLLAHMDESRYIAILARSNRKINPLVAVGHTAYRKLLSIRGVELSPLPFPGNVVINHSDSTSHFAGGNGSRIRHGTAQLRSWRTGVGMIKSRLRLLKYLRPLTASVCREYSIPNPREIPFNYRSRGSLL